MVNRQHKDRLFKRIFSDKKALLSLYNAVNNSSYENEDELEINTLEDAIYMGMKNDISYIFGEVLNLTEHQSTWNPNIPLRGLFYFADLYKGMTGDSKDIYSSKLIELPTPQFLVFYNGTDNIEDHVVLRLSEAFTSSEVEPCLECVAHVYNINHGRNRQIMSKCRKLEEYSIFIERIRQGQEQHMTIEKAVEYAIDSCIEEHILEDILQKNRQEVFSMVLTEYNEQLHIENERRIAEEKADMKWQKIVKEKDALLNDKDAQLEEKDALLNDRNILIEEQKKEIARLKRQLENMREID